MSDRLFSETVPLRGSTVPALLATIDSVFTGPMKVERVLYERGKPLRVERWGPEGAAPQDIETPWEYAKREAEVRVVEPEEGEDHITTFLRLLSLCAEAGTPATHVLSRNSEKMRTWLFQKREWPLSTFNLIFVEDGDLPPGSFALLASARGRLILDVELCLLCHSKK